MLHVFEAFLHSLGGMQACAVPGGGNACAFPDPSTPGTLHFVCAGISI